MPLKNSIQELGQILKLITAFEQELRALLVIFQSFGKLMLFCINFHKIGWSSMGEKSLSSFLLQVEIMAVSTYIISSSGNSKSQTFIKSTAGQRYHPAS